MTVKTFSTGKKWSVGCKKHAIPDKVVDIALKYCRGEPQNVSRGIQEMEAVIQKQKDKCTSLIDDLEFLMDDGIHYTDYSGKTISLPVERWDEIVNELRASIEAIK